MNSDLMGKKLLVGITRVDPEGRVLEQTQTFGVIESVGDHVVVLRAASGDVMEVPDDVERAEPGEYRLRSTGEVVHDPDFIASWTVSPPGA